LFKAPNSKTRRTPQPPSAKSKKKTEISSPALNKCRSRTDPTPTRDESTSFRPPMASELLLHRQHSSTRSAVRLFYFMATQLATPPSGLLRRSALCAGLLYARATMTDAVKSLLLPRRAADLIRPIPTVTLFSRRPTISSPAKLVASSRRTSASVRSEFRPRQRQAHYYDAMSLWKGSGAQDTGLDLRADRGSTAESLALDPEICEALLHGTPTPNRPNLGDCNSRNTDAHNSSGLGGRALPPRASLRSHRKERPSAQSEKRISFVGCYPKACRNRISQILDKADDSAEIPRQFVVPFPAQHNR